MATFGILVGGGPAAGINGVISAAVTSALQAGAQVVGMVEGFRWLIEGDTSHVVDLAQADISRIHLQGGSILQTSRANPTRDPRHLEAVVKSLEQLGIDHLITIGGDDTAYSARRVAESAAGRIQVVHVPKTIDNDLPLPHGIPTFGFETARAGAADTLRWLAEDARTSPRWYFVVVMGRQAGHLALGAGKAVGAAVSLIPEEFDESPLRLETVARILEGAILKGRATGRPHGIASIAEGIGELLDPGDLELLADAERDEFGHIRLAEVPLAIVLRDHVRRTLAERGVKVTIVDKDLGYELRCAEPCAFDQDYTRDLGAGAVATLLAGKSQVLITRQEARIVPIPFQELMDPDTGKTRVRNVDLTTDSYATARGHQLRLEARDLEDPALLAGIAAAGNLSAEEARERFQHVVG